MKFGYFCNTTNWDHKPYNQLLNETKEITTYCDENNWDSIWYTEHHFNHEGMESCTNPLMMGVDAAARTKQIRIGQACNVITFHNPIRLAEDIALLDQLSGGRVDVGIGRGIYGREAINMNKEADLKDQAKNFRLFDETLTVGIHIIVFNPFCAAHSIDLTPSTTCHIGGCGCCFGFGTTLIFFISLVFVSKNLSLGGLISCCQVKPGVG